LLGLASDAGELDIVALRSTKESEISDKACLVFLEQGLECLFR
jgi:hypothetical protein